MNNVDRWWQGRGSSQADRHIKVSYKFQWPPCIYRWMTLLMANTLRNLYLYPVFGKRGYISFLTEIWCRTVVRRAIWLDVACCYFVPVRGWVPPHSRGLSLRFFWYLEYNVATFPKLSEDRSCVNLANSLIGTVKVSLMLLPYFPHHLLLLMASSEFICFNAHT